MWLSKKQRAKPPATDGAELGVTTVGGDPAGVYLSTERRSLPVCSPGGYCWKPRVGEELLVLKVGEQYRIAGAEQAGANLLPGEVSISSANGAALTLTNAGEVELEGELIINGETLEAMVLRLIGGLLPLN